MDGQLDGQVRFRAIGCAAGTSTGASTGARRNVVGASSMQTVQAGARNPGRNGRPEAAIEGID
ncbi:hypothetical protein ACFQ0M_44450 [Kitasatospora aburaviensis]